MLFSQRHEIILDYLRKNSIADVKTLSSLLNVTQKTVRLDLDALQERGLLTRVHGGAIYRAADGSSFSVSARRSQNIPQKQQIAAYALSLIEDNDTVYLDDGSTCLALAQLLGEQKIAVITNDLKIASELAPKENITLFVTGGMIKRDGNSFIMASDDTVHMIRRHRINKAFISTSTISISDGLMIYYYGDTTIKKAAIQNATKVYCLADSSKFNKIAFQSFAGIGDFDEIVTDSGIDEDTRNAICQQGIKLTVI